MSKKKKKNEFKLTNEDNQLIADRFSEGNHTFLSQPLEHCNEVDLIKWMHRDALVGLVSDIHGGIIGYIHKDLADDITTILNIHAINRQIINE